MLRPLCTIVIAACCLPLPGCLIVVDHEGEGHWVHDEGGHGRHVGIYLESVDSTTVSQLSLDSGHVAAIDRVAEGSPADQAGLKPHDIITSVDGDPDASPARVRAAIRAHKPGESLTLGILRQGKPQTVAVTLR